MGYYFSIKDANLLIPDIVNKLTRTKKIKIQLHQCEQKLKDIVSSSYSLQNYVAAKQELNNLLTAFYNSIDDLEKSGVILKDIDKGLIDFPSKRFNEEIWLCWKEGESEIKFWHEKNTGFLSRKPIFVDANSLI